MSADIITWIPKDAGGWIGLVGGLAGLYSFVTSQYRRRLRISVDYSYGNDAHEAWHRFTITNRSDLPLTFRFIGPTWFMPTPLLPVMLNYAVDMEDSDPELSELAPRASISWAINDESWLRATPKERRGTAYLQVGIEVPIHGKIKWIRPRRLRNWDLSVRERLIHRIYGLYGPPM